MKRKIGAGTTSLIERIFLRDISVTTKVAGLTGLSFNNPGLTCYYSRAGAVGSTAVSLVTATVGTWVSGGFKEIDATNMPGWYEFGVPNAAIATGAPSVGFHFKGAANMEDVPLQFELDAVNYQDAVAFGLSRLDAAISSRMATFVLPTNFASLSVDASGRLTLTPTEETAIANAYLNLANGIEAGETPLQFFRQLRAFAFGIDVDATGTPNTTTFKRKDGTTTSFTIQHDTAGNRSNYIAGTN
jgi:hypothetical protein